MNSLQGKVAIVTGAGSGIGRETAAELARRGAEVVVADIHADRAGEVAAEIEAAGGSALALVVDVTDEAEVKALVAATLQRFHRIDILHNNAADTSMEQNAGDTDVMNVDLDTWDRAMNVNLRSMVLTCKYCIPHMESGSSIVNMSSVTALAGDALLVAYSASKAGVIALTRSIAAVYGRVGIRCNAIAPGRIDTGRGTVLPQDGIREVLDDETPLGRDGLPSDIATTVAFLASSDAAYITGQVIAVDGGLSCHTVLYRHNMHSFPTRFDGMLTTQ